jgi:two-component system, chemotaxis family, chemotaxis protein CheY
MKILTIDDSAVMRQMVRFTLESTGQHSCLEAEDGEAALALLEREMPDLIITDLNMPRVNGAELLKILRAREAFKFMPIIVLTTENNEEAQRRCKEAGATGWMAKPFQTDKLLQVVKKFSG